MSGMSRPVYGVNVPANRKSTEIKSLFLDIKPDSSVRLRIMPPTDESGRVLHRVTNHFKLKNPDGGGLALACLKEHGEGESPTCYLCALVAYLKGTKDKGDAKLADQMRASPRWYVQAYVAEKNADTGKMEYRGPFLVGLSKTTADQLNDIMYGEQECGTPFFCDVEQGQDVIITRTGSGLLSRYTAALTGQVMALDTIIPGWDTVPGKLITDVTAACELKVESAENQRKAALRSYPDEIDWTAVNEAIKI